MKKVLIYFAGDSSVGINPYFYTMEIPEFEEEYREEIRKSILELYESLDGEFKPKVFFDGETID